MNKMEILSPAGSAESLEAAVQSGADAVYLGYGSFHARRNAKNFSLEELASGVDYCHLRGVQVFLTLNTLLRDRELPQAEALLKEVLPLGIDAVIVQDLGAVQMLQQLAPQVPLHASTQCAIHSLDGVLQAADLGFSRVVLARELSRKELAYIAQRSPLPLEVFVHGALCMSYSGQCFFSAMVGERSGNRGLCAQACRLEYSWDGGAHKGHPLSLKDMSLGNHLAELQDMGIASLKIEGRMKRPEYVAVVTKIYANALQERRNPTVEEWKMLEDAFSRQGFTQGYYQEDLGRKMFGVRENAPPPKELFAEARSVYHGKEQRKSTVYFDLKVADSLTLELVDLEGNVYQTSLPQVEEARQKALTEEVAVAQLQRTGGTPFTLEPRSIHIAPQRAVPLGKLNQLRREALEELSALRIARGKGNLDFAKVSYLPPHRPAKGVPLQWTVQVQRAEQVSSGLLELAPSLLYLPYNSSEETVLRCQKAGVPLCVVAPPILSDAERAVVSPSLKKWLSWGVTEALVGTLDSLRWCQQLGFALRGDSGLNLSNGESMKSLSQVGELRSLMPSLELQMAQIRDLPKTVPLELFAYGNNLLMTMKNNILPKNAGETAYLTDRKNLSFPVEEGDFGRSQLYNALPLYLGDKNLEDWGLSYGRLSFTVESPQDCRNILLAYQEKSAPEFPFTRGLYYRGVD